MTYEQAQEAVYGMPIAEWKAKHQKKASPEQEQKFDATKPLHAEIGANLGDVLAIVVVFLMRYAVTSRWVYGTPGVGGAGRLLRTVRGMGYAIRAE